MKRISNIFDKIVDINNIECADENARKGKTRTHGVKLHDRNRETNIFNIQKSLADLTYKTSEYSIFKIYEPKEREIYRLPYYPDRIVHHTLMNYLEPIWEKVFIAHSYACRKNKGIHKAVVDIKKVLRKDKDNTKYCLKLDIRKFYPSIDHDILKTIIRKKLKDKKLLVILDEIIDSAPGVPIGNYLSQYFANLYLTYFDHWIKETKKVRYYFRYADDIVIFHKDKQFLHNLLKDIEVYLNDNLKLKVKPNHQVFPLDSRGLDFVGYRFYHTLTLLRKSIKYNLCKSVSKLSKAKRSREYVRRKLCSYFGWVKFCDAINLCKKIINPLCESYNLTTPECIVTKKSIISNLIAKPLRFVTSKIYDSYIKLYVVINKIFSTNTKSTRLLRLLIESNLKGYPFVTLYKKNNRYEITV